MEPITNAVHVCVDMQRIFAPGGLWATPWMERVLPNVVQLCEARPERAVFSRFITPERAEDRPGMWRHYFEKWHNATRTELPAGALDLVPELMRFVPPGVVVDKPAYSAFHNSGLIGYLAEKRIGTLIVTGAETDVCVLTTVLSAIDMGLKVVVVVDAICSSSDAGHDALMTMYHERFSEQIETLKTEDVLALWMERD